MFCVEMGIYYQNYCKKAYIIQIDYIIVFCWQCVFFTKKFQITPSSSK